MAELKSGARPRRHKPYDAATDIEPEKVGLSIQQAYLRADPRMHQPKTGDDIGPKRCLGNRFRDRDYHVAGERRDTTARNGALKPWPEELRRLVEIGFDTQEIVAEEHRRHAEGHLLLADGLFAKGDARIPGELHSDERNDQEIRLSQRGHGREQK